jgi:hypothetical protein
LPNSARATPRPWRQPREACLVDAPMGATITARTFCVRRPITAKIAKSPIDFGRPHGTKVPAACLWRAETMGVCDGGHPYRRG